MCAWEAGEATCETHTIKGRFEARPGRPAHIALVSAHQEPLVIPPRAAVEARLDETVAFWQRWTAQRTYEGRWREAVARSALALKLLLYAPSGAVRRRRRRRHHFASEALGGERNWDYRFSWVRDASFTIDALLRLGCHEEARSFFWCSCTPPS